MRCRPMRTPASPLPSPRPRDPTPTMDASGLRRRRCAPPRRSNQASSLEHPGAHCTDEQVAKIVQTGEPTLQWVIPESPALYLHIRVRRGPASDVCRLKRDGKAVEGGGSAERVEMHITCYVVDAHARVFARDAKTG